MIKIADVFRHFAGEYLSAHGASMLPSHRRAITDIQACRTEALGGHLWRCDRRSIAARLDTDSAALDGSGGCPIGAGADSGVEIRQRQVALVVGTGEPLRRHTADTLAARDIDLEA